MSQNQDNDDETMGEYWQGYKEHKKERKEWHQQNTTPKDKEFLTTLTQASVAHIADDGSGGEKYVIEILTDRGYRTIDWWTSTGWWKVRGGKGEGNGLYRMARYFKLIPGREK